MYAIMQAKGKQYKVSPGDCIKINKIDGDVNSKVYFDQVLMANDGTNVLIGQPNLKNAKIEATILEHGRDKKVVIMKFKRRKDYFRKRGFRALYTKIQINSINL